MAPRKPKSAAKAKPAPQPVAKKAKSKAPKKAKQAPAKGKAKAIAKKTVAKKTVAKKTVAKKAVAKKAVAKKAVAKKTVAKKAVAKKTVAKKAVAKKAVAKKPVAKHASPARDALSALAQKRAIKATLDPVAEGAEVVDGYFRDVDHPFKAEMAAVRQIILGASPKLSERIKWNAPSFYYKEDLGAFNPRATEYAHLILLFPGGAGMQADDGLLEGEHKDRREVKFHGMDDVAAKKASLEKLIKRWVALRDR
jgi:hypothetical protein